MAAILNQWLPGLETSSWFSVVVAVLSPFILTYIFTSVRYFLVVSGSGSTPPTPPYFVPMLGHTLSFAFDTDRYLRSLRSRFGQSPIRLLVGTDVYTFVPHGETIQALFRSRDVNGKAIALRSMEGLFGMLPQDLQVAVDDESGTAPTPAPGFEHLLPEQRYFYSMHRAMHGLLQGQTLVNMLEQFIQRFSVRVDARTEIGYDEWTVVDDLYGMMRDDLFHAAMGALCGDHLFEVAPDFAAHFWEFDASLPYIFKKIPRWLIPKAYAARERIMADIHNWLDYADKHFDWTDEEKVEADWEPIYGAKLMRVRQKVYRGFDQRRLADAPAELGLFWATNSNAIPTAFWTLMGILKSDNLKARAVAEVDECFDGNTVAAAVEKLLSAPLALSMYHESLRYAVGVINVRSPNHDGFRIPGTGATGAGGRWVFNRQDIFLTSSWAGHRDASFWNAGRVGPDGNPEHPVDTWWAERFLEYPDDPTSGPVRKPDPAVYARSAGGEPPAERTCEDDKHATVVTAGTHGHTFPYGGGIKICPGRHFAKSEMMAAAAMMLRFFEIKPVDPVAASKVGLDMGYFPFGALPPDRKVAVMMRRRRF